MISSESFHAPTFAYRVDKFIHLSFADGIHDWKIPTLDWQWIFRIYDVWVNDIAIDSIFYSRMEDIVTCNCFVWCAFFTLELVRFHKSQRYVAQQQK